MNRIVIYESNEIKVEVDEMFHLLAEDFIANKKKISDLPQKDRDLLEKEIDEYILADKKIDSKYQVLVANKVATLDCTSYTFVSDPFDVFNGVIGILCGSFYLKVGMENLNESQYAIDNNISGKLVNGEQISGILFCRKEKNILVLPFYYRDIDDFIEDE